MDWTSVAGHPPVSSGLEAADSPDDRESLPSPTVGRYLCVLFELSATGESRVSTGVVARSLAVEPATVTETFERLAAQGYVQYEPYRGANLTEAGRRVASDLTWRRCVLRTFFEDALDVRLPPDAAYRSGYELPARSLQALADWLDHPCGERCVAVPDRA